jgi:DNA-binding NarL/FixJ family response regulator
MEIFFENQVCLVVEPSKAFLASILACLKDLNLPSSTQVVTASKYDIAHKLIKDYKPRILIAEYDMDSQSGLNLIDLQQSFHEDQSRISIVVSKKSSDSVIADAVEGQVDAFLLKPFSTDDFKAKLNKVVQNKTQPSAYLVKIREGRQLMQARAYVEAIQLFKAAKVLITRPALACYYTGQTFWAQGELALALREFQEGQKFHAFHYKCMTAEFEVSVQLKNYENANKLIPSMLKNYLLTSKILIKAFTAAICSSSFEHLKVYSEQLARIEKKSAVLVAEANAAFFEGGKWYLQRGDKAQAFLLFEKALLIVNRDIRFLGKVIDELLKANAKSEAQDFFAKSLPADVGTVPYNLIAFRIDETILEKSKLIERAREIFLSGHADGETYKIIVRLFAQNGKGSLAEAVISKAVGTFPDLREGLYKILETHLQQSS